jgi:signal transduction histidine kinase
MESLTSTSKSSSPLKPDSLHPVLLETFFGQAPMGIAVFDRQLVLLHCNSTWAEFIDRYTPTRLADILPGKRFSDLAPGAEQFFTPVLERVFQGETVHLKAMRAVSGGIESFWDVTFTPLLHEGEVAGVLDVTTDATERVMALRTLEQRVAERSQEIERRTQIASGLTGILSTLNSTLSPQTVLDFITRRACELLGADACVLYNVSGEHLTLESTFNLPDALTGLAQHEVHRSQYNQAHLHTQPIAVREAREHINNLLKAETLAPSQRLWYAAILEHFQSYLAMPLLVSETLYGGLMFYYRAKRTFTDEDLQLGESLAGFAALAIDNNRLRREESERRAESERRRTVAESLGKIIEAINSEQSLDEVLAYIVKTASQLLGAEACVLHRVDYDQQFVSIQSRYGLPLELSVIKGFPLLSSPKADQEILERRPFWIEDFGTLNRQQQAAADIIDESIYTWRKVVGALYRAWLAVPLIVKDQVYGSLAFYYAQPQKFDSETVDLATTFANQTSLALENAQLHAQAEETAVLAERNRLARELHDAVTQTLFSTSLIAEVLPRLWERNPEEGLVRLGELRALTRGALAEMRTLLLELRPSALMDAELNELFRHLADAFTGRARLPIRLAVEGASGPLSPDVKIAFYRITQEALNNISKHAEASQVELVLRCAPEKLELSIADDGCGFDPRSVPSEHLGVGIMQERAAGIGAVFNIDSAPGKGTRISVVWQPAERSDQDGQITTKQEEP